VSNKLSGRKLVNAVIDDWSYLRAHLTFNIVHCIVLVIALFRESYSGFSFLKQAPFASRVKTWLSS
jgi:hypothetical protein